MRGKLADCRIARAILLAFAILSARSTIPSAVFAQGTPEDSIAISAVGRAHRDSLLTRRRRYHQVMAMGFASSILAHESGHFIAAYAMGFKPHLGFNEGRPTVYSGIDERLYKHKQFVFSAAGLEVQEAIDELVLDVPHTRGSAFERGILAGGIGTTLFYGTIGRNSPVSDITVMARTSSLSKTQLALLFGSVSALHALRIAVNGRYAHFFAVPSENGMRAGVSLR